MAVRCVECGYDNKSQYRYCGMCGVSLPFGAPAPAAPATSKTPSPKQEQRAPLPVSGPSFLGLADDPAAETSYLLEDDEPQRGRGRLYLALVLIAVSAGLLAWHWQRDGYPWDTKPEAKPSAAVTAPAAPSPAVNTPAPVAETPAPEAAAPSVPPAEATTPADPKVESAAPTETKEVPAAETPHAETPKPSAAKPEAAAPEATAPEAKPEIKPTSAPAVMKPKPRPARPVEPEGSEQDALASMGEKYLYGNGITQDCGRAQRSLFMAADRGSAKAQSLLGSMYASGRCANRDLPTAYSWYARALHSEPDNARYSKDLEVLWGQMTPAEKQVALQKK